MYSIQGLRTVSNSLPKTLNKILKKGGHNYSSIINNWTEIVGKKTSDLCYPKSVKTNKELKNGTLVLSVGHGNQLDVEYDKKNIVDKINSFFGYNFIKEVRIDLLDEKVNIKNKYSFDRLKNERIEKKIEGIENLNLKRKLADLIKEFGNKTVK